MARGRDPYSPLWRQGLWLGIAWGVVEVGVCRWVAPLSHVPALAEIALSTLFWTSFALMISLALRPWGKPGRAVGPLLLIGLFFAVTVNLLVHPFLFSGANLISRKGLLYTLWFTVILLAPAMTAAVSSRQRRPPISPVLAVLIAVLMGLVFAVGRTRLVGWPAGLTRVYAAVAMAGLAEALALVLMVRMSRSRRWSRGPVAAALLALMLCPVPWSLRAGDEPVAEATAPSNAPPVILISLDTTRPDHLSYFGYPVPTSPHLDRFLSSCRVFPVAYATSPWTVPSHASVFTGLYPRAHGAHYAPASPRGRPPQPLDSLPVTLAEHFRDRGYATAAIAANDLSVSSALRLDRGFETVDSGPRLPDRPLPLNFLRSAARVWRNRWFWRLARPHRDAVEITDRTVAWIRRHQDRPYFLFVNYFDPHEPYAPPLRSLPDQDSMSWRHRLAWSWKPVPKTDRQTGAYDGEIHHMDEALGRLFDELSTSGVLDRAVIAVFSDHGEFFGELGLGGHGREVHEAVLRALLAIRLPGGAHAGVDSTMATLADMPSLVMEGLQGRAPRPREAAGPRVLGEVYLTLRDMRRAPRFPGSTRLVAVRSGDHKLIGHGDTYSLYDLNADPLEAIDIAGSHPDLTSRLQEFLEAWERAVPPPVSRESGNDQDELRETLRGLGYFQ